jgi:hypothetical protein
MQGSTSKECNSLIRSVNNVVYVATKQQFRPPKLAQFMKLIWLEPVRAIIYTTW